MHITTTKKGTILMRLNANFYLYSFLVCGVLHITLHAYKHESSYPFISGDTFRALSNHIIDETNLLLDPQEICLGDIIFVKTDYLNFFFKSYHTKINNSYILITHNSAQLIDQSFLPYFEDSTILAWFGQNAIYNHPKLIPIPVGIANKHWKHGNTALLETILNAPPVEKSILVYMNFDKRTYPAERNFVWQLFSEKCFTTIATRKPFSEYLIDLAQSYFVLSPQGKGIDCHRIWETLLAGSYPIVKSSSLDHLFTDLPVILINNWEDITENFLQKKLNEMQKNKDQNVYNYEKLYMPYWINKIEMIQSKCRKK